MIGEAGSGLATRPRSGPEWTVRFVEATRHVAVVGIAGVITGVMVGGLGGRVLMRMSAIAAPDYVTGASTEGGNVIGEITVDGTIALVAFVGILSGLVGAVAYVISEPWLAWTGKWHGLALGLLLLAIGSTGAFDPGNQDFLILGNQELNVAMFVALFIGFGLLVVPIIGRLERSLPQVDPARPVAGSWAYLALAAFGLQFLGLFFIQFFDADASGAETAPVTVGIAMVGVTVATLVYWARRIRREAVSMTRWASFTGHGLMLAAAAIGAVRATGDIVDILTL